MNVELAPHTGDPSPDIDLYLIRHGESAWNAQNTDGPHIIGGRSNETPLTSLGEEQARARGRYLLESNIYPDRVYTSPAVRALSTCGIVLTEMGIEIDVTVDDALQELDQGEWVGRTREEVYTPAVLADMERLDRDFKSPGGESMREAGARLFNWADHEFAPATEPLVVFVFGHGMVTRSLAAYLHNWSRQETFLGVTDNTSQSLFKRHNNQWTLAYLGRMPK